MEEKNITISREGNQVPLKIDKLISNQLEKLLKLEPIKQTNFSVQEYGKMKATHRDISVKYDGFRIEYAVADMGTANNSLLAITGIQAYMTKESNGELVFEKKHDYKTPFAGLDIGKGV
ncbi:MAG: hypothetical protein PF542_01680 [Nanoarchaeota archaeon]|jgi:hypothetical protein|nr:hypothetical protein [Nanoarchaeota archaeon]